jgi:transposase
MKRQPVQSEEMPVFIGIDYHEAYSVYNVLDVQGESLGQGRIDHAHPEDFSSLVRRWPGCRVVFEAGMNWHWLFEILERELSSERIVLANPFKTRIIAEAQIKTDKVDARILADLLRGKLVPSVHIVGPESRQIKEVLRQRCFFVRQRTMLRNRIHRLLGAQHEVKLPQCSDLFGRKGLSFLDNLELPAPARLLLTQQLALLKELAVRIHEDEKALEGLLQETPALNYVRSLPGMGPILAAVVVSEIDGIERFPSAQKLCGYAGLCPSTHSSGGKTFQGKLLRHCNKWLRSRLRRGGLGCHRLLGLLRGLLQTQASAWQEAQPLHPGHGASYGSNHLAALDAAPGLHEPCPRPNTSEASLPSGLPL